MEGPGIEHVRAPEYTVGTHLDTCLVTFAYCERGAVATPQAIALPLWYIFARAFDFFLLQDVQVC